MVRLSAFATRSGRLLCARFFAEEHGQDLIEYALLTGVIASGTIALLPTMRATLSGAYQTWGTERNSLWIPAPPGP